MAIRFNAWMLALAGCLLVIPAVGLAAPAMAEDEGPYIGAYGGQSRASGACASPSIAMGTPCMQYSPAYRIFFGYQYTPMWALEVGYGNLVTATSNGTYGVGAPQLAGTTAVGPANFAWSLRGKGWTVQAVATVPLVEDIFSAYGKVGLVFADFQETNAVIATNGPYSFLNDSTFIRPALGAGLQFNPTPKMSLRAQYEILGSYGVYPTGGSVKVSMISGGILFKY